MYPRTPNPAALAMSAHRASFSRLTLTLTRSPFTVSQATGYRALGAGRLPTRPLASNPEPQPRRVWSTDNVTGQRLGGKRLQGRRRAGPGLARGDPSAAGCARARRAAAGSTTAPSRRPSGPPANLAGQRPHPRAYLDVEPLAADRVARPLRPRRRGRGRRAASTAVRPRAAAAASPSPPGLR